MIISKYHVTISGSTFLLVSILGISPQGVSTFTVKSDNIVISMYTRYLELVKSMGHINLV